MALETGFLRESVGNNCIFVKKPGFFGRVRKSCKRERIISFIEKYLSPYLIPLPGKRKIFFFLSPPFLLAKAAEGLSLFLHFTPQNSRMMPNMIFNKSGDKIIAMIVTFLHSQS